MTGKGTPVQWVHGLVEHARDKTVGFLLKNPLKDWPSWAGKIHGLNLPKSVIPQRVPTPCCPPNINIILTLLEKTLPLSGEVAECGVFRGATLIPMARLLVERKSMKKLFGFDSFQGFDDSIVFDLGLGGDSESQKKRGGYNQTSLELVDRRVRDFKLERVVNLVPGTFKKSLVSYRDIRFSFVHLDCDLYCSYQLCLEFFYPRMVRGGIILFDEYEDSCWPGCTLAIDRFFADKAKGLQSIEMDNFVKYFFEKAE